MDRIMNCGGGHDEGGWQKAVWWSKVGKQQPIKEVGGRMERLCALNEGGERRKGAAMRAQ